VFGKKRRANKNIGSGNSYFALEKILKLYKEYNVKVAPNTNIFLNRSIRDGLNNLLKNTNLKHTKIGIFQLKHAYSVLNFIPSE
jgi:hypothetical protein